jgi:hypothetical protein
MALESALASTTVGDEVEFRPTGPAPFVGRGDCELFFASG